MFSAVRRAHLRILNEQYKNNIIEYDSVYNFLEGWIAYAKNADTYQLRRKILTEVETNFPNEISTKEIYRHFKMRKQKGNISKNSNLQ
jgi:hypothetical protein